MIIAIRQSAELSEQRRQSSTMAVLIVCTIVCIAKLHAGRATAVYVRCARNLQMQALASFFACGQHRKGGSARKACGCFSKNSQNPLSYTTKKAHLRLDSKQTICGIVAGVFVRV